MIFIIIGVALVLIAGWVISVYNSLVTLRERVSNATAQIATQIESRWDALRSLIDATKEYSKYEGETLEKITESRASIGRNSSVSDIEADQSQFNNVLGRLIAVSESYPDLKASNIYQSTMDSINQYENNVRNARMIFNDIVTKFNRKLQVFPSNIVASIFNFKQQEYFQATESKQEMPRWN